MTGSPAGFEVRAATERDGPRMAELDRKAFGSTGMGHYGESHVRCWLEVNPEGLLVASRDGTAVACCYSQYVDFSPEDVSLLTTDAASVTNLSNWPNCRSTSPKADKASFSY